MIIRIKFPSAILCPICCQREGVVTDHDHRTGKIRGCLCHRCNRILGMARDSASLLRSAARFLELNKTVDDMNSYRVSEKRIRQQAAEKDLKTPQPKRLLISEFWEE